MLEKPETIKQKPKSAYYKGKELINSTMFKLASPICLKKKKVKRQATECEKLFVMHIFNQ